MEKIILEGIELEFNDFTDTIQEKLYLKNKNRFQNEVVRSKYANIRRLIISEKESNLELLNEVFNVEVEVYGNKQNLNLIWNHHNFEKNDEKCKLLAESDDWAIRIIPAEDEESSSELLNQMLREEKEKEHNEDVMRAILDNKNLKMEGETFLLFSNSENEDDRETAGSYMEDSILLNALLRQEIEGEDCSIVIEAILENENFEMEQETLELLADADYPEYREMAAKDKNATSEFLNRILRNELEEFAASSVIKAAMNNQNFKMEEQTLKMIEKTRDDDALMILVNDIGTSKEWLEKIYLTETDKDLLEAIELNLTEKFSKNSITLNAIQKRRILAILKELKHSKKKQPLSKYLEKILEIIG